MSWYVETLILTSDAIRNAIYGEENLEGYTNVDIENDDYNNLVFLEKRINELYSEGYVSKKEMLVISAVSTGKTMTQLGKELKMDRENIKLLFSQACEKISYILGGIYTDEGYLDFMQKKHNLSDLALEQIREFIQRDSVRIDRRFVNDRSNKMYSSPYNR